MATSAGIHGLFAGLRQTGSPEAVFEDALRLACEAAACPGGAVVGSDDTAPQGHCLFRYDPANLFDTLDDRPRTGPTALRRVEVPLRFGHYNTGNLVLLAPSEFCEETIRERVAPFDTVLATLVAANIATTSRTDGMLFGQAFRQRVASEIARAKRFEESFSIVQLRLLRAHGSFHDVPPGRNSSAVTVGEALISRLRKCDVVGVMAPHRVAVLLAGTGPLGAKIAVRRIEQCVQTTEDPVFNSNLDGMRVECVMRSFPEDGSDVDVLCDISESVCDKTALEPTLGV